MFFTDLTKSNVAACWYLGTGTPCGFVEDERNLLRTLTLIRRLYRPTYYTNLKLSALRKAWIGNVHDSVVAHTVRTKLRKDVTLQINMVRDQRNVERKQIRLCMRADSRLGCYA